MKLTEKFKELKNKKEGALIGFVTAGDPTPDDTIDIVTSLMDGGIDILELGLPFSDPIADGEVIQKASERSLNAGMNPDIFFEIAKKIEGIPKVCLTYYNLVLKRGLEKFAKDCQESGINGLIIPDLPIEEAVPLMDACTNYEVNLIFLVAPTTTDERMKKILSVSSGFLYVVSLLGITGARKDLPATVAPLLKRIGNFSGDIPLAVGFGISTPGHVRDVLDSGADGVIVGSAFVRLIEKNIGNKNKMLTELEEFTRELKQVTT
ncbi:MAG: tryptophan synthase subunit alpha [Candidatus Heimdallarchaeota archaeon]|nr:tryptophan synthase subunit alpha [Candidatus Heimdallarchaeota archaeon]